MNTSKHIVVPLIRDIKTIPPTISIINFLASKGFKVTLFIYNTEINFDHANITIIKLKNKPYPKDILTRIIAKIQFHVQFYHFFQKKKEHIDLIWLGAWDVIGIRHIIGNTKLVYQYHEYEENKFKQCRIADHLVVPEVNRGWITYVKAKLKTKPIVLPNIPNYGDFKIKEDKEILTLKKDGNIVVLYSGLIDNKKRNLTDLVSAFEFLPKKYLLVIIPSFVKVRNDLNELKKYIINKGLQNRVRFLDSRIPPYHLNTMATSDVGIGFYNPTSLNNIYAAPNRLYEFINFGTPVVLPNFPAFTALSKLYPFAISVTDISNPKEIAIEIEKIIINKEKSSKSIIDFKSKEGDYNYFANKLIEKIF